MQTLIKNGSEIERRFLLKKIPDLSPFEHVHINQYYLNDKTTRIRNIDNKKFILTQKSGSGLNRTEIEYEISYDHFEKLKESALTHIAKTRYYVHLGGHIADLDIFEGPFKGIVICEVEFPSIEEANVFIKPSWFGADITFEKKLSNKAMSKNADKAREYFEKICKKYSE